MSEKKTKTKTKLKTKLEKQIYTDHLDIAHHTDLLEKEYGNKEHVDLR